MFECGIIPFQFVNNVIGGIAHYYKMDLQISCDPCTKHSHACLPVSTGFRRMISCHYSDRQRFQSYVSRQKEMPV
jgi:hypothetical protein